MSTQNEENLAEMTGGGEQNVIVTPFKTCFLSNKG